MSAAPTFVSEVARFGGLRFSLTILWATFPDYSAEVEDAALTVIHRCPKRFWTRRGAVRSARKHVERWAL